MAATGFGRSSLLSGHLNVCGPPCTPAPRGEHRRLYRLQPPATGTYQLRFEFGMALPGTDFYLDDIQVMRRGGMQLDCLEKAGLVLQQEGKFSLACAVARAQAADSTPVV